MSVPLTDQIRDEMINQRLTQQEVADRAGIPQSTVSRALSPDGDPLWSTLSRIVRVLDCDVRLVPRR